LKVKTYRVKTSEEGSLKGMHGAAVAKEQAVEELETFFAVEVSSLWSRCVAVDQLPNRVETLNQKFLAFVAV
jgi:hypothetical protein